MNNSFDQEWRQRFERFARTYETEHQVSGWSERGLHIRFGKCMELLSSFSHPPSMAVLDVGCGAGTYVRHLAAQGHRVVGLDYSRPTIRKASALDPEALGRYLCGGVYNLPFADEHFDLVLSIGVIQAISDPRRALRELSRVVKSGGILVVEALNAWEIIAAVRGIAQRLTRQPPRLQTYSPRQMRRWLREQGIRVVEQKAIVLTPRQWHASRFSQRLEQGLESVSSLPLVPLGLAHSFLYCGQKYRS